jgi:hypothetical protein
LSSPRSSRLGLGTAALGLVLLLPVPAGALDIKLWPLFRYASDGPGDAMRWTALGPLVEFTRTADSRDLRIRPVLWLHQRRGPEHDDRAEILFPLAATRWQEDYQSFRFLLFFYRSTPETKTAREAGPALPAERASRFSLFPFVFYRHSPETGTQVSVLPFYLDLPDVLGYEHVKIVMFPAYVRLTEPRVDTRYAPFPFVSSLGGEDGRGFSVWPFYGDKEIVGRQRTAFVLWPFHIRSERLVAGYGWETRRIDLPAYAALDGAGRRSRAYGVLAYTHTVDERHGYEATGSPWPLVFRDRALGEDEYRTWRMAPFFGRSDRDGISSRFYAWPAYRTRIQDTADFHFERRDAILVLWRQQRQWSEATGHREDLTTLFPVWRSEVDDGRPFGQAPAVMDSLVPKNRGVLALWAPLYGLVRWDTESDGVTDWNVGWGLVAGERGHLLGPWHVALDGASHGD